MGFRLRFGDGEPRDWFAYFQHPQTGFSENKCRVRTECGRVHRCECWQQDPVLINVVEFLKNGKRVPLGVTGTDLIRLGRFDQFSAALDQATGNGGLNYLAVVVRPGLGPDRERSLDVGLFDEGVSKVVQACPRIVNHVPDEQSNAFWDRFDVQNAIDVLASIRIDTASERIRILADERLNFATQSFEMCTRVIDLGQDCVHSCGHSPLPYQDRVIWGVNHASKGNVTLRPTDPPTWQGSTR